MSLNRVLKVLKEAINEAGDLGNIPGFKYHALGNIYLFIPSDSEDMDEDGLSVKVEFEVGEYDNEDVAKLNLPSNITKDDIANVSYKVNGFDTQATKSNYKTLIRIIKTVSDITIDWLNRNKNIQALTIFAANKNAAKYISAEDPQKDKLYQAIIIKNISKLPGNWNFTEISNPIVPSIKGIAIYKTK
jgi:hypothetical protein